MLARFSAMVVVAIAVLTEPAAGAPPEIAEVAGVPNGDTLTIRSEPRSTAPSVGALQEGSGPVEILGTAKNGATEWARISFEEGEGWAARRYLRTVDLEPIGETSLTVGLICGGTEPFWSVSLNSVRDALWRDPETGRTRPISISSGVGAAARGGWPAALTLSSETFKGVLVATPTECSDGMSDRAYAWTALLVDQTESRPRLFEGCCGHNPVRQPR